MACLPRDVPAVMACCMISHCVASLSVKRRRFRGRESCTVVGMLLASLAFAWQPVFVTSVSPHAVVHARLCCCHADIAIAIVQVQLVLFPQAHFNLWRTSSKHLTWTRPTAAPSVPPKSDLKTGSTGARHFPSGKAGPAHPGECHQDCCIMDRSTSASLVCPLYRMPLLSEQTT